MLFIANNETIKNYKIIRMIYTNVCLSLVSNGKLPSIWNVAAAQQHNSMIKLMILRVIYLRVPLLMSSSIILECDMTFSKLIYLLTYGN